MLERPNKKYELLVVGNIIGGLFLVAVGAVSSVATSWYWYEIGMTMMVIGCLACLSSIMLSSRIERLRILIAKASGGSRYDQLRNWTRLKVASILLATLLALSFLILGTAVSSRMGLVDVTVSMRSLLLGIGLVNVAIVASMQTAHWYSLRAETHRIHPGLDSAITGIAATGACLLALLGGMLTFRDMPILGAVLSHNDAPFFLLAAFTLGGVALFTGRALPTIYALFYEEREYYKGKTYMSRSKSVIMPTMMAFSLLFGVVLLLFVFEIGLAGLVQDIGSDYIALGAFLFIVTALLGSIAASVALLKKEDKAELFQVKRSARERRQLMVLTVSAILGSAFLFVAGLLYADFVVLGLEPAWWLDVLTFGMLAAMGPYGFYVASEASRVRSLEERFPDFLRDIAASHKAGLPMPAAVSIASRGEYGALTPEIRKMADQLTWNVSFNEVLDRFADRVDTPLVRRSSNLMVQASAAGGSITDVLLATSRDAREIKNLENERRGAMGLYTAVIYITFFVFLGVAVMMYNTFIRDILAATSQSLAAGSTGFGGVTFTAMSMNDFLVFYYMAALVQAIGNGIVAGTMGTGNWLLGLRHSFVMTVITYVVFKLVV